MGKSFAAQVSLSRKATEERIDFACVKITRELFNGVIDATPVKDGWLVNNWQTGLNNFNVQLSSRPAPTKSGPRRRMEATVNKGVFMGKDAFVTMSNATEYAHRIEYLGWSRFKSPQGMVRITLASIAAKYGA